jgi:hypothetical protein
MNRFTWFSSRPNRSQGSRHRRLFCEQLERREVLAATLADDFIMPVPGGSNRVDGVSVDSLANTYVAGYVNVAVGGSTIDFDPANQHLDEHDLITLADSSGFLAKYDAAGSLQWVFVADQYVAVSVSVGSLTGNVYVGLRDDVNQAHQIGKLDSSDGTLLWASPVESANNFTVDELTPSTARLYAISGQIISGGHYAKINAYSVDGSGLTLLWGKGMQPGSGSSTGWGSGGEDIEVSPDHASLYISGGFKGNTDFDPSNKTFRLSTGSSDFFYRNAGFVWKLTSDTGSFVWAGAFTLGKYESSSTASNIEIDPAGNVIVAGQFSGQVDLDPGKATLKPTSFGGADTYIAKLNPAGGLIFARNYGTENNDLVRNMTLDANGDIYISGKVAAPPGQPRLKLDSYIQKITNAGAAVWMYSFGGGVGTAHVRVGADGAVQIIGDSYADFYVDDTATPKYTIATYTIYWVTLDQE